MSSNKAQEPRGQFIPHPHLWGRGQFMLNRHSGDRGQFMPEWHPNGGVLGQVVVSSYYLHIPVLELHLSIQYLYRGEKCMQNAMTHYMELLATSQPWHLLIFMAVPVICAETLAITELIILFTRNLTGKARLVSKITGIFAGLYFLGIFIYLFITAVIPLTATGGWRGPADVIAVGFYLSGIIPFLGMLLLETGIIGRRRDESGKLKLHAILVGIFLVVAHVAMIIGMINPNLLIIKSMGISAVFVTHNAEELSVFTDRICVMDKGSIIQEGKPEDVFEKPANEVTAGLVGVENVIYGIAGEKPDTILVADTYIDADLNGAGSGTHVKLFIRPENVLYGDGASKNCFIGKVEKVTSLSSQYRLIVNCGFNLIVLLSKGLFEYERIKPGSEIKLCIPPERIHIVNAQ
jgi:hypothetical protein